MAMLNSNPVFSDMEKSDSTLYVSVIKSDPPQYRASDSVFALFTLVLGFLMVRFVFQVPSMGIGSMIFILLLSTLSAVYLKQCGTAISKGACCVLLLLAASSAYYLISENNVLSRIMLVFQILCLYYFMAFAAGNRLQNKINSYIFADLFNQFFLPLANISTLFGSLQRLFGKSGKFKTVRLLLAGILIALPVVIIVIALMSSADSAFSGLMENIGQQLSENVLLYIWQFILGIPLAVLIFALLHGNANKRQANRLTADTLQSGAQKMKVMPPVMGYGAMGSLIAVYTLFFCSQLSYFLSGFSLHLPEGFSYSDYARRGFFELCAVASINLLVITLLKYLIKSEKPPKTLKVFNIWFSVYTLGFIVIAISKMVMYMIMQGLTRLRIFTTAAMTLMFLMFVLMIFKQLFEKLNIIRVAVTATAAVLMLLCFGNVDAVIARHNVERILNGEERGDIVFYMSGLSDSVVPEIERLYLKADDTEVKNEARTALYYLSQNRTKGWESITISSMKADTILSKYVKKPAVLVEWPDRFYDYS